MNPTQSQEFKIESGRMAGPMPSNPAPAMEPGDIKEPTSAPAATNGMETKMGGRKYKKSYKKGGSKKHKKSYKNKKGGSKKNKKSYKK